MRLKTWMGIGNGAGRQAATEEVPAQAVSAPPPMEQQCTDEADEAVNTLATVLRDFGHYAFDTDQKEAPRVNELCEQWARHILYGAESPRQNWRADNGGTGKKSDWLGLRHFALEQRQNEYAHVMQSVGGMRSAIWTFVREMKNSFTEERDNDSRLRGCLCRLDDASRQQSVEAIRREIAATAVTLTKIMNERKVREKAQTDALYAQIRELGSQLEEARQEISLDSLTQLYNRKSLDLLLARAVDMRTVFNKTTCLIMVDIDHFKQVNDSYGHVAGDAVLKAFADCLTRSFPRKGDYVARFGGEEFAVLVADARDEDGKNLSDRLLRAVREMRIAVNNLELRISVSIGTSEAQPGDTIEQWVERADQALYRAKQNGRDCAEMTRAAA